MSKSINQKMIAILVGGLLMVLLPTMAFLGWSTRGTTNELTEDFVRAEAGKASDYVNAELGEYVGLIHWYSAQIETRLDAGTIDRTMLVDELRTMLMSFPGAFGTWFIEEPQAFDGRGPNIKGNDALSANKDGLLSPYWYRDDAGKPAHVTFDLVPDAEWYTMPTERLVGSITNPFMDPLGNLLTTVVYPIQTSKGLIGIVGVNVKLNALAESLGKLAPMGDGQVRLVSNDMKWIAHPDADHLGEDYSAEGKTAILEAVLKSNEVQQEHGYLRPDGVSVLRTFVPFQAVGLNTRWVAIVDVPMSTVGAPVRKQLWTMAGGLFAILAVLGAVSYLLSQMVTAPISSLRDTMLQLADGDLELEVPFRTRTDEVGEMAEAVETFRENEVEKCRLAAEAEERTKLERAREQEEAERQKRELEEERAREEQHAAEARAAAERERAAKEKELEAERAAAERERKAEEERRIEAQKISDERAARAAEQSEVVDMLADALSNLSEGDLTCEIDRVFPENYERLRVDFNKAVQRLAATIQQVSGTVEGVFGSSNELNDGIGELSRRTESQAATLEETSAALVEITETVRSTAEGAREADTAVATAKDSAEEGGQTVRRAVDAMDEISKTSQEISSIINVIDGIAFQTNLLALNAGVEAARAGDAGRGFAVVASEVRALSQRSSEAAREIRELISSSSVQVDQGVDMVGAAGEALKSIVERVVSASELVANITSATQEQADALSEINMAVNSLDQITQQNSGMVDNSTVLSTALAEDASRLRELLEGFETGTTRDESFDEDSFAADLREAS